MWKTTRKKSISIAPSWCISVDRLVYEYFSKSLIFYCLETLSHDCQHHSSNHHIHCG